MALEIDALLEVNEGTTPIITGTLKDENGTLVPDESINAVTMAVHDYTAGTELRAATALTPASSVVTSWLTQAEARIIDSDLDYEYRVVTMSAQYSTTKSVTEEVFIKVINLRHHEVSA